MKTQDVSFISGCPPFNLLPNNEIMTIGGQITELPLTKSHILSVQGKTKIDKIYIIKNGALELYYEKFGKKTLTGKLITGNIFGGISILMNSGISVRSVVAKEDTILYVIDGKIFRDICNRYKHFYEYFVNTFSKRMLDESYATIVATNQAFLFLSQTVPFSFLPRNELEKIASRIETCHYPENTILFIQDKTEMDALYIIQKGAAERYYGYGDKKTLRGILGEGDVYGGISLLLNKGISVRTLKTIENTYFYKLSKNHFIAICEQYPSFIEYFTDTFGKRMLDRSYAAIITKTSLPKTADIGFHDQPVKNFFQKKLVTCGVDTSIRNAANLMSQHRVSSIFIKNPKQHFVGVVTDNDLRKKVVASGYDIDKPVSDIMSSPLKTISNEAMVFEALMTMMQKNIKHLAVSDTNGRVSGIITNQDFLTAQGQSPFYLMHEISAVTDKKEIFNKHKQLPKIIQGLINSGAKAKNINRLITAISDASLYKIIEFAIDELGPPPANFIFMTLGSEGRREQTLKTDQDNAIIFEDQPKHSGDRAGAYFLKMGEKVCNWLDRAGYDFCKGNVMAKNPHWCQPLSIWKGYFSKWIFNADPEDLLQASIFFDFRGVYGNPQIINDLHSYLFDSLVGWAGFFRNLTENALHFKPPIGFFRNFVVESRGRHRNVFDIKRAMVPIVDFARIYALKHNIKETNTQERLVQLYRKKVISRHEYDELEQSYSFLMQLRFVRQITAIIKEEAAADNYVNPRKLSSIEQTMLKEIFKRTEKFQAKLGFDFIGIN